MNPAQQHARALAMALYCLRNDCPALRVEYWLQVSHDLEHGANAYLRQPAYPSHLAVSARAYTLRNAIRAVLDQRRNGAAP